MSEPRDGFPRGGTASAPPPSLEVYLDKGMDWFNRTVKPHWRQFLAGMLVVMIGIAVAVGVAGARNAKLARGFAALTEAEDTRARLDVADEFAGTLPGTQAAIQAARKLYEEGKFSQAETRFGLVLQSAPDSSLAVAARFGEAYSLEAQQKFQAAEKRFASLVDDLSDPVAAVDACLGAARCARLQKKFTEAEKWIGKAAENASGPATKSRVRDAKKALQLARVPRPQPPPEEEKQSAPKTAGTPTGESAVEKARAPGVGQDKAAPPSKGAAPEDGELK